MIDDKHKVIFIHFVKTGGSSIENYFGKEDGYAETMFNFKDGSSQIVREQHHTSAQQFIQQNGIKVWDECFKFSLVRNPWDWFVSHFFWDLKVYHRNEKVGHPQKYRRKFIVEECQSNFITYCKKGAERPDWFKFPCMKEYSAGVDFVGRFENIQKDFDKVCDAIKSPRKKLAHLKKPDPRPHYSHFYDDKCIEIVYNIMRKDVDHYGYLFEKEEK